MTRASILATLSALALTACNTALPPNQADANLMMGNDAIDVIDATPDNATTAGPETLTAAGLGALKIGMNRADLVAAAGDSSAANADPEACEQFHPARAPAGVLVMLEQGKLTRISLIRDATLRTDAGLGLGATADQVKAAYGARAVASPHKYVAAPAGYITLWQSGSGGPGSLGFVYELGEDGKVTAIHAGGPAIQYVEGCS